MTDHSPSAGLAESASPFLRHGAEQPVEWLPWGNAAFDRARQLDRPVLLDIGAVWCHWCHVMDRESYEDPDTAALINELYVPVKVDRDERPDVDARYQRAVQSLVGQGGWPLTAFLTPEGEVFHGGTYFPPEDAYGRPSFRRVLREVARVWSEDRERAEQAAGAIGERLDRMLTGEAAAGEPHEGLIEDGVRALVESYDGRHGGFGDAPKFPNVGSLALLLDRWVDTAEDRLLDMLRQTLMSMGDGGIHDQLGGGFHRYSTDARWIIPHFEKMAYDNGPLLELYARAAAAARDAGAATSETGEAEPAEVAAPTGDRAGLVQVVESIVAHYRDVAGDLVEEGGFPASQDADIGFEDDGDYWTWTEEEISEALTAAGHGDAVEAALLRWGVRDRASEMHLSPDRHVLFRALPATDVAGRIDRAPEDVEALLERARVELKRVRDERPAPYVDRTLYAGWVAMVASGHLAAARHVGLEEAGEAGIRALERVWREAWRPGDGLLHRLGDADSGFHLLDQAHAGSAFLDAFEWTQDPRWLERAQAVAEVIARRFEHPSGALRDLPADADAPVDLLRQGRLEITDSPEPSPTAVAAIVFARLGALQDDDDARDRARRIVTAFAASAPRFAPSASTYFRALRWVTGPVTSVVVVEPEDGSLLRTALAAYRPATVVRRVEPGGEPERLSEPVRAMMTGEAPAAYVCAGRTCAAPVSDPASLRELMREFTG